VQGIGLRPQVYVSADGSGVVGHAGARLLADLAEATGLTAAYSATLMPLRPRGTGHDPGRVATDLAVMLADGGEAIADLAVLLDQAGVFGAVASTPTAWRLLADTDETALAWLRAARGSAREVAWMQAAETGEGIPAARSCGRELPGLVLDLYATLVTCHSEKEQAAPTYKGGFGCHPLLCFLADTGEALSGRLRPGNSGANTAADHVVVLDQALAQIPDAHRHGTDILIRADSAGSAKAFLAHVRDLRKRGIRTFFSVGCAITEPVRRAIRSVPDRLWHPALNQDGTLRDGAEVAELTGMIDLDGYPTGTPIIVRREGPHPGAQLSLFDQDEGLRHQVFLTDTPTPVADPPSSWRSATAGMPRSRTTSGAARPPDSAASPPVTSPSTPSGSNSASRRSTFGPGRASCCWTGSWPLPSRKSSATGCCTSPPASPTAADACAYGSATWPWRNELATAFHRLAALPRPAG
jgi:thioesterase domain-containing protein